MLKLLYGDLRHGRLGRRDFLLYNMIYLIVNATIVLLIWYNFHPDFDIRDLIHYINKRQTLPFDKLLLDAFAVLVNIILLFPWFNFVAKRLRDTGLPGWWMQAVVLIVIFGFLPLFLSDKITSILGLLFLLFLLITPTDSFKGKTMTYPPTKDQ